MAVTADSTQQATVGATVDGTQPSLTDPDDLIDSYFNNKYINNQINQSSQPRDARAKADPAAGNPKANSAIDLNSIDPIHRTLATVLANLQPQPMSPDGIVECLKQPELTAAWLEYASDPGSAVRSPAAYIRNGVRRGAYPPPSPIQSLRTKEQPTWRIQSCQ